MAHSDILFQDEDVCILRPEAEGGVLVFHMSEIINICSKGLYSYNKLRKEHPELKLPNRWETNPEHNDLIYFRAPYNTDTTSFESSFNGKASNTLPYKYAPAAAVIRVDPDKTFVYLSEARAEGTKEDIKNSRISMKEYLNEVLPELHRTKSLKAAYLGTKRNRLSRSLYSHVNSYGSAIVRFFEVVVKRPHIPPSWFVSCHVYKGGGGRNTRKNKNTRNKTIRRSRAMSP